MDSALILIWEYYGIFRSGLIQQTNQNCLFSLCQAREKFRLQWNLDITKGQGTGNFCSL